MRTFLLTWNPRQGRPADLKEAVKHVAQGRLCRWSWSVGNRKALPVGSRVFLLRQTKKPRGIVASGFTRSVPAPTNNPDDHSNYCEIDFTMVLDADQSAALPLESLQDDPVLRQVNWKTQCGGMELSYEAATQLESLWLNALEAFGEVELTG
jgi:hypothetical protein